MRRALAIALVLLGTCSRAPAEPSSTSAQTSAVASVPASAYGSRSATELALRWDDPPRWQRRSPSNATRAAEYLVPRASGDSTDAECVVITFGRGQGGGVDENMDRWVGQFGALTDSPAKSTRSVKGMTVTRVEVAGTYRPMRMPGAPPAPESIPGSRLVGAILQAPSGSWFFKMTGPDATVKAAATELDKMVDSARPN
jgi:hypothetical protein